MITSWYELLKKQISEEDFVNKICTLSDSDLMATFDNGPGDPEGKPFTCWAGDWVYFPLQFDGQESVGRAPRNPCNISMSHQPN